MKPRVLMCDVIRQTCMTCTTIDDLGCVRLGNPDLDLKNLDLRISNRTQNLTTDFVADSLIGNPCRVRISINKIRREIRFRILCSIGNPEIQILRSKYRFPNRTHPLCTGGDFAHFPDHCVLYTCFECSLIFIFELSYSILSERAQN